jgi:hypothetical protein
MNYSGLAQYVHLFEQPACPAVNQQTKDSKDSTNTTVVLDAQGITRHAMLAESLLLKSM